MTLYFIGLGLDEKDISLKGVEAVKKCSSVYLEDYTGITPAISSLERLLGKKLIPADRKLVEESDEIIKNSKKGNVALLASGDPLAATTHADLFLRAKKEGVECEIIHCTSIFSVIAETGLQLYRFGATASIPLPEKGFEPESFYGILKQNRKLGLHTLFLLDLKTGQKRFLEIKEAIEILLKIEEKRKENVFGKETLCIGCARLGTKGKKIICSKASEILKMDFGNPPYCLIVPGKLHFMEEEMLNLFKC